MLTETVGELRKLLDKYPDNLPIQYMDEHGYYCDVGVVSVTKLHKIRYPNWRNFTYSEFRLKDADWIEDVEVLVLG